MLENQSEDIVQIIRFCRANAFRAVNAELINLYYNIGEYISKRVEGAKWGDIPPPKYAFSFLELRFRIQCGNLLRD